MPPGLLAQGAVGVAGAAWANHKVGLLAGIRFSGEIGGEERLLSRAGGGAGWRHFLNLLRLMRRSLVMSCVRLLVVVLVVAAISGVVVSGAAVDTVDEVVWGRKVVGLCRGRGCVTLLLESSPTDETKFCHLRRTVVARWGGWARGACRW